MATNKPVPSQDPSDLLFNAEKIDEFVSGTAPTYTTRKGDTRQTLAALAAEFPSAAANAALSVVQAQTSVDAANASIAAKTAAEAARDASLIQAGVYATTGTGLAAVSGGQYFKVVGSGTIAASEYRRRDSVNLFNATTVRADRLVNSSTGVINTLAGWGCSAFIPVTAGSQYTISGTRGRFGLAFFTAATDSAVVSGSVNNTATLPLTVTAPAGANFLVINLYSDTAPSFSNLQVEPGVSATTYIPFGSAIAELVATYPSGSVLVDVKDRVDAVVETRTSRNIFDTATVRADRLVNSSTGVINTLAGWGCSAFIPVTAGAQYTISGSRGRFGLSFFTAASDSAVVSGSYNGTTTLPLTVTAPAGANFLVINLYSATAPTYANVQVEPGAVATAYMAFGTVLNLLRKELIDPPLNEPPDSQPRLVISQSGQSYIRAFLGGGDYVDIKLDPFKARTHSQSEVFNFGSHAYNGVDFKTADDDVAPYRAYNTTIGANHGYAKTNLTLVAHGKTLVDVGSVWSNGTEQWVIVDVPDVNTVSVTARASNNSLTTGSLTHVSGATHTSTMTPTGYSQGQWYQVIKNRSLTFAVDGLAVEDYEETYPYERNVTISESYEIMNKTSMVEWLITQVGTPTNITAYQGTSDISVSMSYVFDPLGNCTIFSDFLALNAIPIFLNIMFAQMFIFIAGVAGPVKYYIPKTLPFTQDGTAYDFRTPYDMTGFNIPTRLDFTSARTDATGQLADRVIMMNDQVGMAIGYVPVQAADPAVRRTNAATKALQISELAKIYMSAIDSPAITSLTAGTYFSGIAYRNVFKRSSVRTGAYVVRTPTADYLYCDWHANLVDRVPLPPDLHGRAYTLVEKSSNVTIRSAAATSSIVFDVAAAGSYGFAVIRFPR